jgi:uncharacterized protein YukE
VAQAAAPDAAAREAALRHEVSRLRAEVATHARAAAHAQSVVDTLRAKRDGHEGGFSGEAARAKTKAKTAAEVARAARRQAAALERVCAGLREKVVEAEVRAERGKLLEEEVLRRELMEAEAARAKGERDVMEGRVLELERELAALEGNFRGQKAVEERCAALEEDLRARDQLLRDVDAQRSQLNGFLQAYEEKLQVKEREVERLVRVLERLHGPAGRRRTAPERGRVVEWASESAEAETGEEDDEEEGFEEEEDDGEEETGRSGSFELQRQHGGVRRQMDGRGGRSGESDGDGDSYMDEAEETYTGRRKDNYP